MQFIVHLIHSTSAVFFTYSCVCVGTTFQLTSFHFSSCFLAFVSIQHLYTLVYLLRYLLQFLTPSICSSSAVFFLHLYVPSCFLTCNCFITLSDQFNITCVSSTYFTQFNQISHIFRENCKARICCKPFNDVFSMV